MNAMDEFIEPKTIVIFRKEKEGTILAVFPYNISDLNGDMTCYGHIGQHSAMCPEYLKATKPCKPEEYEPLKKELESIGYDLKVQTRVNWNKYLNQL